MAWPRPEDETYFDFDKVRIERKSGLERVYLNRGEDLILLSKSTLQSSIVVNENRNLQNRSRTLPRMSTIRLPTGNPVTSDWPSLIHYLRII